jgi:hypothetical protein
MTTEVLDFRSGDERIIKKRNGHDVEAQVLKGKRASHVGKALSVQGYYTTEGILKTSLQMIPES